MAAPAWRFSPSPSPLPPWRAWPPSSVTRYPQLQWATYDAVSDENRLAGLRSATGRDVDLMLRFDRATVILALDADPLLTDPEMIRHARGFAAGRRAGASGGRDEPALRGRRGLLADGRHGGSSAPSPEPADRAVPRRARGAPWRSAAASRREPASRVSTRAGSTPWPRTFWRTAARGSSWPGNASPRPSTPRSAP